MRAVYLVLSVVLTFAAFCACGGYGLCYCDDAFYVSQYAFVMDGLTWAGAKEAFVFVAESIWMPLTWISYMIDYSAGWGVGGMHLVNVSLHALNAGILFLVLVRLLRGRGGAALAFAFLATLAWSLHPLRVESVVWVASRKDELSTLFFLWALGIWTGGRGGARVAATLALLAVGALAKPSVMVFPAFAFAADFLFGMPRKHWSAYVVLVLVGLGIAAEGVFGQSVGAMADSETIPVWYRLVNAGAALTIYLGNLVFPKDLALQCSIKYPFAPRFSPVGAALLTAAGVFLWRTLRRRVGMFLASERPDALVEGTPGENLLLGGLLVFFASFVPFLGIVGFGYHAFADRFTILPTVAFSLMAAVAAREFPLSRRRAVLLGVAGAAAVVTLGLRTQVQIGYWRDDDTLARHTLDVDGPDNLMVYYMRAVQRWECERDLDGVCRDVDAMRPLLRSAVDEEKLAHCAHFYVDAAYRTGRREAAEEMYSWVNKWNYRTYRGKTNSLEYLMCEILYYINSVGNREVAAKKLAVLEQKLPDHYVTRYLAYCLAEKRGDPSEIRRALERCPRPGLAHECRNRWAERMLKGEIGDVVSRQRESGKEEKK